MRDMVASGDKLIFTPSFGYMEPTLKVAKDFPDVKFESITGYKTAPNVAIANARYYEGRYLAGIAAGRMTKTHLAGYVARLSRFPRCCKASTPSRWACARWIPRRRSRWCGWAPGSTQASERDAAMTLFDQDVDVLAFHTASTAVMAAAQERGKLAIAYHSDMRKVAPDAQVLAVTHQWGDYYRRRVQAVLDGTWKSGSVWGGVKEGMIRVGCFGPKVPKAVQEEVLRAPAGHRLGQAEAVCRADRRQRGQAGRREGPGADGCADTGDELSGIGRSGEGSTIGTM